jgi:hypothetical protein
MTVKYSTASASRAAATVSEQGAALLRRSSPAAQSALLTHLAMMEAQRPAPRSEELWRVHKGARCLACIAVYLPHGVDLQLLEDGDIRRTELLRDGHRLSRGRTSGASGFWPARACTRTTAVLDRLDAHLAELARRGVGARQKCGRR